MVLNKISPSEAAELIVTSAPWCRADSNSPSSIISSKWRESAHFSSIIQCNLSNISHLPRSQYYHSLQRVDGLIASGHAGTVSARNAEVMLFISVFKPLQQRRLLVYGRDILQCVSDPCHH